ncbi:MAG: hypothetical protein ABFD64_07185 [Armatimonadota bacterium]
MIYPMMVPPFELSSFDDMTKKQAQEHFDWYISCIPERVKLLEELFNEDMKCNIKFDYSIESLEPLWRCFEEFMRVEEETGEEFTGPLAGWGLKKGTFIVAHDISIYYGEVFSRNVPPVHWGFFNKPKVMGVNRPVLLGFRNKVNLEPVQIVLVACKKSKKKPNPRYLIENLHVWMKYLDT